MSDDMTKFIETSNKMIAVATGMLKTCKSKKKKVYSHSRFASSFLFRRSWEMFESFLILVKEGRIIDSAVLLRSFLDMGITLGYIFAKDIDEIENEKRACLYLIEGNKFQLKLANSNMDGFRKYDIKIEERRDELEKQVRDLETEFKKQFGEEEIIFPSSIEERAKQSNYEILRKVYDISYRVLSSIEHHSFFFGQGYVDGDECEPLEEINHLKRHPQLKLSVSLFYFKLIFIEVLNVFNEVFRLSWDKQVAELRALHDEEYVLLRD